MTLQHCFNKEAVKKQLQEVLLTARHVDAIEREVLSGTEVSDGGVYPLWSFPSPRQDYHLYLYVVCIFQGVAMGVGLCANSHLEGTLAKLEEFSKSDAFKKSPSIFNLLKVQRLVTY